MPADYEMLVSHSPPVYGAYLSNYAPLRFPNNVPRFSKATCRSASANSFLLPTLNKTTAIHVPLVAPRRPCLVIRPEDTTSSDEDPTSPTRLKKKVVFADDRGMSLTHVRIMTEPSNVPPFLSSRFLAEVTQGLSADPISRSTSWEITFAQPASDYLEFRRKLDCDKVSLENVIIKENEDSITGTIKVSNMSFEKEVFVRSSSDNWLTNEDTFCAYVNNSSNNTINAAYIIYDTFSFKLALPPKARRLEFCICFRSNGNEFWDNNSNNNYVLIKQISHPNVTSNNIKNPQSITICNDAVHAKIESWSEFASWNHLENSSPYW